MKKKTPPKLITTKVTETALKNFKVAAAMSGLTQYEVSEEGSEYVHGKYLTKPKTKK